MIRLIINTVRLLMKKKSYLIFGILVPAFVIVFFSFEFGNEYKYKVGVIDKENSYISEELVKSIDELEDVKSVDIKEEEYKILLISQQIEMVIIIEENFENIIIKSIKNNDLQAIVKNTLQLKYEDLKLILSLSDNNLDKFKQINGDYNDESTKLSLNDVDENAPQIENSLGIIIFMTFIICSNICNFIIDDEENKTKIRILSSGISKWKYYFSLLFVFYIMSSLTSIIYYILCKILHIDFGMTNTNNFLVVLLFSNLIAISFNLCIISFTKSRYTSSILNILIVVPCCMLSGVFWDFNIMPSNLQKIGENIPTRWIYNSIEILQKTNNLENIYNYLLSMMILSIILFTISFIKLKINREI